ncbi:MAG: methyltransferase [Selenomonadaceae bacterium]|nr:methyltransferase [Selenomonadaceae bacterium]
MIDRQDLFEFVPPNFSTEATALVIGEEKYLPPLRELMPAAKIFFMTEETSTQLKNFCDALNVKILVGDYQRGALPNETKIFDVIIADDCLTHSRDVYPTLAELNNLLTYSGFLVTKFFNARFIGMLENLRRGRFPTNEKIFWAKWDVVKLFHDAFFKEIHFLPKGKVDANVEEWLNFGFENFSEDLLTKIWLVKACKCTAEVAALKEFFSEETRAELSRLLHRVDFGIDVDENISRIKKIRQRERIFDEYFTDFVNQVVFHEDARKIILERTQAK